MACVDRGELLLELITNCFEALHTYIDDIKNHHSSEISELNSRNII